MSLPRYTFVFESEIAEHTCMSKYHQLSSSYHAHLWFSTTLQSNRSPVPMKGAMCVLYQEQSMVPNTCNSVGPTILTDLNHLSDQVQKGFYEGKNSGPLKNYPLCCRITNIKPFCKRSRLSRHANQRYQNQSFPSHSP